MAPPLDTTLSAHLDQLAKATTVAFGGVGITGARLPATDAYFALEERLGDSGEALRPELEKLLKRATPAGRVYAAELLNRVDRAAGRAARDRLLTDHAELTRFDGCLMSQLTVSEYARTWLRVDETPGA